MQLATAAYACPAQIRAAPTAEMQVAPCEAMSGEAMDADQPNLCKAHCEKGQQSAKVQPAPDFPAGAVLACGPILSLLAADAALPLHATRALDPGPARGSPPLYITYLVLRN